MSDRNRNQTEIWQRAAALFDQLATLDPQARDAMLAERELTPDVQDWLDTLLAAHDREQTALIDRQMTELMQQLVPDSNIGQDAGAFYQRRFGPWQALGEIGRGGMGLVLEGQRADGQFEKRVAIKLLDSAVVGDTLESQLRHELKILASLSHPGIAQLLDGGVTEDGLPYLVMEYVDGVPINQYCDQHDLDRSQRLELFSHVADAVSYCHRRLVVHADIKPDNVLVDQTGQVKLLDFGIASRLTDSADDETSRGIQRWCSPAYAAPERLQGAPAAVAEDVYALAALLYELLTGARIRSAPQMTRLIVADAMTDPTLAMPLPVALHGDLGAIFRRALAPESAKRYADVDALAGDLQRWRGHYPVHAYAGGAGYRACKWLRRNRVLSGSAGLIMLALIVGSGLALWQSRLASLAAERAELNAQQATVAQNTAELALQRADAINEFLIDLFEAEITGLPPDEMPTTRQLVDQGIQRTRDPETGPPKLRAELMLTLADILGSRYQIDDADALLEEAEALIAEHQIQYPDVLIQAALLRVDLAWSRNNFDDTKAALEHTEYLLKQHQPDSLQLLMVQRDLGRVEMRKENNPAARALLEAVLARAEPRTDAADLKRALAGDLAVMAARAGEFREALKRFEQVLVMKQAQPDITAFSLASTTVNIATAYAALGDFDLAIRSYEQVLGLLEPFIETPLQVRATALKGLADIHRKLGQFDLAKDYLQSSAEQWRQVLELPSVEDDFFIHYYLGELLADQQHWSEAIEALQRAIERMQSGQEAPAHRIAQKQADIAQFYCHLGQPGQASGWLAQAAEVLDRENSLAMAQAEARCALVDPDGQSDPALMPMAAIEESAETPGDAVQTAQLELLRAELQMQQHHCADCVKLLDSARARLEVLEVSQTHPLFQRISQLNRVIADLNEA